MPKITDGTSKENKKIDKNEKKAEYEARVQEMLEENARLDEYYDGYYNDIVPKDDGEMKKAIDKEIVKKIGLIVAVLAVVIVASIFVMFL